MVSFKYIQINDIIQTEQVIFSNTCIYVCMQIYIYICMQQQLMIKGGHEFGREQGVVYGRL